MAYASWSVVFGEQPSASKWNILGTNDAAFNNGGGVLTGGLADDAVTAAKMQYGMVRNRQGGTTGDATWATVGTSNTDTSAKVVFLQVGSVQTSAGGAVTVTFPSAFTQAPIVFTTAQGTGAAGYWTEVESTPTTTAFTVSGWSATGTRVALPCSWIAVGQ